MQLRALQCFRAEVAEIAHGKLRGIAAAQFFWPEHVLAVRSVLLNAMGREDVVINP